MLNPLRCIASAGAVVFALYLPRAVAAEATPTFVNQWLRSHYDAATNWDLGAEFRLRYEDRVNAGAFPNRDFIRKKESSDDYLLFRERVHIGYKAQPWLNIYVEGRDSRALFDKRAVSPEQDEADLQQAFLVLGDPNGFPVLLKIGRQELTYGDERLVGVSDWSNTRRAFDAAKLRYETRAFWLDLFTGRIVVPYEGRLNVANDYDQFSGIYASTTNLVPAQQSELFFFSRNVSDKSPNAIMPGVGGPGARDIYTPGLRLRSSPNELAGWDYSLEAAGQFGSIGTKSGRMDHQAFAGNVLAGYTWSKAWATPRFGLDYTYASGDSNPKDDRHETFELLFGTNHRYYGAMDLFGLRNIHNPSASLTLKPLKDLSLRAEYLLFWLADTHDFAYPESAAPRAGNGYGIHSNFHSFAGSELDLLAAYQPVPWAELQCGYGHFFVGDYIRASVDSLPANGGVIDADWVYVQAKLTF